MSMSDLQMTNEHGAVLSILLFLLFCAWVCAAYVSWKIGKIVEKLKSDLDRLNKAEE